MCWAKDSRSDPHWTADAPIKSLPSSTATRILSQTNPIRMRRYLPLLLATLTAIPAIAQERSWIAGDHHIHSRWSVGWDRTNDPPTPIKGGDAIYPIPMNALMAQYYGLSWMVATDHGGPNHSKVNREEAYPELLISRQTVPGVIQFWGMELDTPEAEHSSLIIPHTHDEADVLYEIEQRWARLDAWPPDSTRDRLSRMIEALDHMKNLDTQPIVIANHPSRTATDSTTGRVSPAELRQWNDTAPNVAVGMAGAPGHQAAGLNRDGSPHNTDPRGGYRSNPTLGGFDRMTAMVGGFWDSMLGEGRRWWITANSDSHVNWKEGGADFWPGEYSKTYVLAEKEYDDILDGIRSGRVFVATGDLISELRVTATHDDTDAGLGGEIAVPQGADVTVTIRFRDPDSDHANGGNPEVGRVDLITGQIHGIQDNLGLDVNPSTKVAARFTSADWQTDGEYRTITTTIKDVQHDMYLRVRGTNTMELEPTPDPLGENPWEDLWFYSNPVFIAVR
jgi:hypothetical protein